MDLEKLLMIYYMIGGKISDDPTPPDDTEYTITVDSNVDAVFTSDGLNFVNGVAKTKTAGTYEITAQADGYNTEKKSITVNDMNPNGYWYFDLTEQSTDPSDAWRAEYSVRVLINGEEPTRAYQYYYYSYDSNGNYSDGEAHNNVGEIILKHEVDDFDSNNTPEEIEFYVYINDNYDASAVFTNEPTLVKIDNGKAYYYLGEMNVEIAEELIEYKIVADSNVENAVFKGYNYEYGYEFSFVNKVAQISKEGSYTVFCSAPGYIGQKLYVELNDIEPVKEIYFELEEVNSETGDPSKANKAEYSFEVTINGETAKGNKEVRAYFNNNFENVYSQVEFISSGKIVVKYLDENFNGYPTSSFDVDLNINGIPDGYAYESFVIENPVLTKVENGVAYYSFGVIDVTMEDESTAPNYSIYVYSNPSGATFSSDGLVFNSGLAEVSGVGEYTVNAVKPGYYDKNFVVKVTEENPNAVYKVNLDKAPVEYTITATANTSDANFSSYPYLSFNSNGVAEVYEIGEYEIECFSDGYVEQRKTVIVDESNKNPSVHFDLELDPDNPPYYSRVFYQVEITVDGKEATGYNSFEYVMRNDDEGVYESDYYSGSGKILLGVEAYSSNRYVDTMNLEFSMDREDYSFVLVNPVVKKYDRDVLYVEFDSVNVGENVDPEPEVGYTITVDSNVPNAIFSNSALKFVNGVAKTKAPGTYVVYCRAEGYKEQSHIFYLDDSNPDQNYYFELEEENYTITLSSTAPNTTFKTDDGRIIEESGVVEYNEPGIKVIYCSVENTEYESYTDEIVSIILSDKNRYRDFILDPSYYYEEDTEYGIRATVSEYSDNRFDVDFFGEEENGLDELDFSQSDGYSYKTSKANKGTYTVRSFANGYENMSISGIELNENRKFVTLRFESELAEEKEEWFIEDVDYEGDDAILVSHGMRFSSGFSNFEVYENNNLIYRVTDTSRYGGMYFRRQLWVSTEDFENYQNPNYSIKRWKKAGPQVPIKFEVRENAIYQNDLNGDRYNWSTKEFMDYSYSECEGKRYPKVLTRSEGIQANYYNAPNVCYNDEEYPNIKNYMNGITVGDYTTEDELERNQVIVRWNSDDPYIYTLSIETSGYYESKYTDEVRGESFYVFTAEEISEAEELVVSIKIRENYVNSYSSEIILKSNGESPEGNYLKLESINNLS